MFDKLQIKSRRDSRAVYMFIQHRHFILKETVALSDSLNLRNEKNLVTMRVLGQDIECRRGYVPWSSCRTQKDYKRGCKAKDNDIEGYENDYSEAQTQSMLSTRNDSRVNTRDKTYLNNLCCSEIDPRAAKDRTIALFRDKSRLEVSWHVGPLASGRSVRCSFSFFNLLRGLSWSIVVALRIWKATKLCQHHGLGHTRLVRP
ncbi:hypothetical protein BD289DRAFT_431971 [Coniella lustricola]|uniref:Uncharacterized protein n=1 Tax=Coniella lustricola TaxID=2025994 RepID=A0A2T3AAD9_9PEZI|nr:hypothetical protein BD289DRAFT_431971 [Coniella lustricola]